MMEVAELNALGFMVVAIHVDFSQHQRTPAVQ